MQEYVLIGKECSGKSQLARSLTGSSAYVSNFSGSTISCEVYNGKEKKFSFIDTPGIVLLSDTITTRTTLDALESNKRILLVVKATHIDQDLADLLPLVKGKCGLVIVTFWDRVMHIPGAGKAIERLQRAINVQFIPVNARSLTSIQYDRICDLLKSPQHFTTDRVQARAGWQVDAKSTLFEYPFVGPIIALLLLLLPACVTIWFANNLADSLDPLARAFTHPLVAKLQFLSSPFKEIAVGRYGFLTMTPLLFVWAVPTVFLYSIILGIFKASGLMERMMVAVHPLVRPFGIGGRDLMRVIMGFGCNVPAVINTRACSACSRRTCISAIAFGSACSYQFGATLAVFNSVGKGWLVVPYMLVLLASTLIYARLNASPQAISIRNSSMIEGRTFLKWPHPRDILHEARGTIGHFANKAIPIFLLITVIASILEWIGFVHILVAVVNPVTQIFNLPSEAALPIILASIRKDGILLFGQQQMALTLSSGQILTEVYLAGTLLPCLVTAFTIAREQDLRFTLLLIGRQVFAAVCFSLILAWSCRFFGW